MQFERDQYENPQSKNFTKNLKVNEQFYKHTADKNKANGKPVGTK